MSDWEDSTICRSCGDDVSPRKLGPGGYCGPCLVDAAGTPEEMDRERREWEARHAWDDEE